MSELDFRVLVCGGRGYVRREAVFEMLDALHRRCRVTLLINGDARGADRLATQWALNRNIPYRLYPAKWEIYGDRAGPARNEEMLRDSKPHLVVAFPGSSGTAHMVKISKRDGVRVWDLRHLDQTR